MIHQFQLKSWDGYMKIETESPIFRRVASVRTSRIPNSWGAKGIDIF